MSGTVEIMGGDGTPYYFDEAMIAPYADDIMGMIAEDVITGKVPGTVHSFADLHDHVDANDYLIHAGLPWDSDADLALNIAVSDEVSLRLAEWK